MSLLHCACVDSGKGDKGDNGDKELRKEFEAARGGIEGGTCNYGMGLVIILVILAVWFACLIQACGFCIAIHHAPGRDYGRMPRVCFASRYRRSLSYWNLRFSCIFLIFFINSARSMSTQTGST